MVFLPISIFREVERHAAITQAILQQNALPRDAFVRIRSRFRMTERRRPHHSAIGRGGLSAFGTSPAAFAPTVMQKIHTLTDY
jgi:hypothetical protein